MVFKGRDNPESYPEAEQAVDRMIGAVAKRAGLADGQAARAVNAALEELARIDRNGLISVGDDHEWTAWATLADRRAREL